MDLRQRIIATGSGFPPAVFPRVHVSSCQHCLP